MLSATAAVWAAITKGDAANRLRVMASAMIAPMTTSRGAGTRYSDYGDYAHETKALIPFVM